MDISPQTVPNGILQKKLLNIKEVCFLTGLSKECVYHSWPEWKERYGIRVYKVNGDVKKHAILRFEYEDILKLIESWQVN